MKSGAPHLSLRVPPCLRQRVPRRASPYVVIFLVSLAVACLSGRSSAQSESGNANTIRGIVINSVTREPVARALVYSAGNRFATLTNGEGRFEFNLPKLDAPGEGPGSPGPGGRFRNRPSTLMARKPGFLSDSSDHGQFLRGDLSRDLTLVLIPEALIVGNVALPTGEAPDPVRLQVYRRKVQDGRGHYVPAGFTQSTSDGQFRFAELSAGAYKLVTEELLDRDPLTTDPLTSGSPNAESRGPLSGYPPVYYQSAPDFGSASTIQLSAGQTQTVSLSLVKQSYYRVKVPVTGSGIGIGVSVDVYAHGNKGPGFSLGYNNLHHAIEGMLPNGTYTVEASSFGANGVTGIQTITVQGAPVETRGMALLPNASIRVNVKEDFTSSDRNRAESPRRYLNVALESADDFGTGREVSLRKPTGAADDPLVIEGAPPGSYWVRVHSSRGYPAAIRSGNLDLQHQPLVVGVGGGASPIEITMRDDLAEISGTVEEVASPTLGPGGAGAGQVRAHVYCIPLPDSSGQFTEIGVGSDGRFDSPALAPGTYRVLAFDQAQREFEYRNPEAMQVYDSKGQVVRLTGGQKEQVQLHLISMSPSGNEE